MARNSVVSNYCVLIIIRQLKLLKFQYNKISVTCVKHMQLFIPHLLERGEKVSEKCTYRNLIKTSNY